MDFDIDGRLLPRSFISPGKRSVELVPPPSAEQHGFQASNKLDISRNRVQGGDRSRIGDTRLHSLMNADKEKGHTNTSGFRGEVKKESEVGTALFHKEIAHVRADGRLARDVAEPDSQRVAVSKLRDSRNEEGHALGEEDETIDENLQAKAGKARSRILQVAVSQGVRQAQLLHQQQQPQPQQAPLVRWERFLPQRQLRVLLVEDDDSTRHVVSALLRNCSYEVTFAANGLLAWELLLDQTNRIDLVLTEVVMPCLSGIELLSRIMGLEAFKHIPVIMMSSHDSMGIVFKCLSNGAVDFLVKPVRKNELKNLWQHVWRRCHSSSGSGSSSGSQTQKVACPKVAADCNDSGSNDESDNTSSGLNAVGGSDNGSETQSSWTKKAVEVQSSQHQTDWHLTYPNTGSMQCAPKQPDVLADPAKGFAFAVEPHKEKCFDDTTGQDSEIVSLRLATTEPTYFHKDKGPLKSACVVQENAPVTSKGEGGLLENTGNGSLQEDSIKAIDLIGAIAGKAESSEEEEQGESEDGDDLLENRASNSPISKDKTVSDFYSPPLLELTLKRPSQFEDDDREKNGGRVLRHSCSSAFSRYNTGSNHIPLPSGTLPNITNCKPAGYGGHAAIHQSNVQCSNPSSASFPPQLERVSSSTYVADAKTPLPLLSIVSNVSSKQDGGLPPAFPSSKDGFAAGSVKDEAMPLHTVSGAGMPMPIPLSHGILYDGLSSGYGPIHHPMFYVSHANAPHWGSQAAAVAERGEDDDCCGSHEQNPAHPLHPQTSPNPKTHCHSHHHNHHHHSHIQRHYHHHHHRQHLSQQRLLTPQQDDQTVTNVGAEAPICGSSNMVYGPEGNNGQSGSTNGYGSNGNGNGSVNGSATGSNNGSNNGQSAVALAAGGNGDSGPHLGNSGTGTENGLTATNGALSGLDQNRFARREAALTKFRQKRKERCFEKKVRYQSRKRLAEQRPRVRGQFVRQSVYESTAGELG